MKLPSLFLSLCVALTMQAPGFAEPGKSASSSVMPHEAPPLTDNQSSDEGRSIAKLFEQAADRLGAKQLTYIAETFNPDGYYFVFFPPGQDRATWSRMVTVQVEASSAENEAAISLRTVRSLYKDLKSRPDAVVNDDLQAYKTKHGTVAYFTYHVGQGDLREHNAVIVWPRKDMVCTMQVQARKSELPEDARATMLEILLAESEKVLAR